jgi:hypothetical protein
MIVWRWVFMISIQLYLFPSVDWLVLVAQWCSCTQDYKNMSLNSMWHVQKCCGGCNFPPSKWCWHSDLSSSTLFGNQLFFINHNKYINAYICNFTSSFDECETSSLKLRAEYKREEVAGGWKKLHNDGLHTLVWTIQQIVGWWNLEWGVCNLGDM